MVGKQTINNCQEIFIPKLKAWWHSKKVFRTIICDGVTELVRMKCVDLILNLVYPPIALHYISRALRDFVCVKSSASFALL